MGSSGHGKKPLISYQIIRKAKDDFPNLSFCMLCCAVLRVVPTLLMNEDLPDMFSDDLVNYKFHMKRRPEGFISQTTAVRFCPQAFSPDVLASGLCTLVM